MFNIDRKYSEDNSDERYYATLYNIRTKHKDNPTLPNPKDYGMDNASLDDYLERQQDFVEWKKSMEKNGPIGFCIIIMLIPVVLSFIINDTKQALWIGLAIGISISLIIYGIYLKIKVAKKKKIYDDKGEKLVAAYFDWNEKHPGEED